MRLVYAMLLTMPIAIKQRVADCYKLAETYFKTSFPAPEISLTVRGQKAGVAYLQRNTLGFNLQLYQENHAHFLTHTVAHEVAHLIAYQRFGGRIKPHGVEWRSIMQEVFHLPAERCHTYAVAPRWRTLYGYRCQCPQDNLHQLSAQRHRYIQQQKRRYLCKACTQELRFTEDVSRTLS